MRIEMKLTVRVFRTSNQKENNATMKNEQSTLTEKQAVDGLQPDIDVNNEGENEIIDVPIVNKKEFVVTGLMSMLLGKTNHGVKEFMKQLDNKKRIFSSPSNSINAF